MDNQPQDTNTTAPLGDSPAPTPQPSPQKPLDKKLLFIILGALGLLLIVLIILVFILIGKKDSIGSTNSSKNTSSSASSDTSANSSSQKVVKTVSTDNPKLEVLIYEPTQSKAYTTINFGVKNICKSCSESVGSYLPVNGYSSATSSFLLDDSAGKKYSVVKDADGNVLASPECNKWIYYNQQTECFVSFSKVPSGTTISWVFGDTRIDGIKIP